MKILILSPYPPYPPHGGGAMRIYQLIRGLAARHDVTCLTFAPDIEAARALTPLQAICRVMTVPGPPPRGRLHRVWTTLASPLPDMALRNASRAYSDALSQLFRNERFDIVHVESIEMAEFGLQLGDSDEFQGLDRHAALNIIGQSTSHPYITRLILDEFNAEYVLQQRAALTDLRNPKTLVSALYSLVQWRKLAAYERHILRSYDHVLAVSEEDRHALFRLDPNLRISVIPNGVDTAHFSRAALARERSGLSFGAAPLVFSGTLDFRPNVDAVTWFARAVLPRIRARRPDTRLLVVGKRPAPALRSLAAAGALTLTGEVPDARPYIAGAAVYVVPMRIGGGVRLKLLEALALEAPIVSTSIGAEGLEGLRGGAHCLLADDPADFADSVLRLLDDPALGRRLGAVGRALVRERYDWSAIIPRLEAIYEGLD